MPEEIRTVPTPQFVREFEQVQLNAFRVNLANGWWDDRTTILTICQTAGIDFQPHLAIELIGLMHTELSEAVEAARKHDPDTWGNHTKKDTLVRELAGTVVRIMDMSEYFGLPLAQAIEAEIEANRTRGFRHGGKAA